MRPSNDESPYRVEARGDKRRYTAFGQEGASVIGESTLKRYVGYPAPYNYLEKDERTRFESSACHL